MFFFLIIYFSNKLLAIAGSLLLFTGFFFLQNKRASKKKKYGRTEAEAVVLSISQTGLLVNNKPQVKLQVQVLPDNGRNFVTEIISVSAKEAISAGVKIRVSFNPANHRDVKWIPAA